MNTQNDLSAERVAKAIYSNIEGPIYDLLAGRKPQDRAELMALAAEFIQKHTDAYTASLQAENARLQELLHKPESLKIDHIKKDRDGWKKAAMERLELIKTAIANYNKLQAENARLREALSFYGVESTYDVPKGIRGLSQESYSFQFDSLIARDKGQKAREALLSSTTDTSSVMRVVRAAVAHVKSEGGELYGKDGIIPTAIQLIKAVEALPGELKGGE